MAKTIAQKIAAAEALLLSLPATIAALKAKAVTEFDPTTLTVGERIKANAARGGKEDVVIGVFLGAKIPEGKGSTFLVLEVGEGIDKRIVNIVPSQVLARLDVAQEGTAEQADPLADTGADEGFDPN